LQRLVEGGCGLGELWPDQVENLIGAAFFEASAERVE